MPKLLQINITANWGSTGKIAEFIGLAAIDSGWESYIAYGRWSNPSESNLIKVGGKLDKYLHYGEQKIRDNEGLCSRWATHRLIRKIKEIAPDIVQLHNIHDHYLNYQILFDYLNKSNTKVVWTFHDCWAFTGHCFHFVTKNCEKWKAKCEKCPLQHEYPYTIFDNSVRNFELKKYLFQNCKSLTIVPCSDWMKAFVEESFLKNKRINVIRNGIDLNIFKIQNDCLDSLAPKNFIILAVSNIWNREKGYDDLFQIREELPEFYSMTVVGLSKDQVSNQPNGIRGIQCSQNVQELVKLYNEADVLLNPTYADTFPTVNLEALACGTPVITYKTGGSPEAVNEETGFVVEQGDIKGIVKAVEMIRLKGKDSYKMACRNRAEQYFDKVKQFKKYIELYKNVIS